MHIVLEAGTRCSAVAGLLAFGRGVNPVHHPAVSPDILRLSAVDDKPQRLPSEREYSQGCVARGAS